uniref:Chloride conductance regulatory protein ICln n=1 Tax=Oryza nivara TaxID=4536 RepID=A0A0E0IQ52_ORYNI
MVLGLYAFADIAADGAPHLNSAAGEELVRVERAAAVALGSRAPEPPGTLFITTSEVEKGKAYAVDFLAVSLHAVSRDPEAYSSPCIYTQIETEDGSDEESDESDSEVFTLEEVSVDGLFEAFSHCAELNPDPNAESDEENGWAHRDEGDEDMTGGSDAECEFSDVNPIGQTDEHDITHAVVETFVHDELLLG